MERDIKYEIRVSKDMGLLVPDKQGKIIVIATYHLCGYEDKPDSWYMNLENVVINTPGWSVNLKKNPNWGSGEYYTHSNHLLTSLYDVDYLFNKEVNKYLEDKINEWILS